MGNPDVAEDVVQETFLAALGALDTFRGDASPLSWLTSILRRKIADEFRRQRRGRTNLDHSRQAGRAERGFDDRGKWSPRIKAWTLEPSRGLETEEFWEAFEACLARLPASLAAAFRLRQLDGWETDLVCEFLQISYGNLSVRLHRARLLLRACLERSWFLSPRGS
jgi:RNA polymerase sigma-70 factor (ECF subfamily)